jgi:hypothetical protein
VDKVAEAPENQATSEHQATSGHQATRLGSECPWCDGCFGASAVALHAATSRSCPQAGEALRVSEQTWGRSPCGSLTTSRRRSPHMVAIIQPQYRTITHVTERQPTYPTTTTTRTATYNHCSSNERSNDGNDNNYNHDGQIIPPDQDTDNTVRGCAVVSISCMDSVVRWCSRHCR